MSHKPLICQLFTKAFCKAQGLKASPILFFKSLEHQGDGDQQAWLTDALALGMARTVFRYLFRRRKWAGFVLTDVGVVCPMSLLPHLLDCFD